MWSVLKAVTMRSLFSAMVFAHISSAAIAEDIEPCQKFAELLREGRSKTTLENPYNYPAEVLVDAETAYQCATSIPISNDEVARVIYKFKNILPMYSTLGFLKNPPASYQQPSIDVMAYLDHIDEKAKQNKYANFYEYESDLSLMANQVHDQHFRLRNGGMYQFRWYLPDDIVSVSRDGKELPQVYVLSDISRKVPSASPIIELDEEPIVSYLERYARTKASTGLLEPHAEWNALMYNPAIEFSTWGSRNSSSVYTSEFRSTSSYNGNSIKGKFANGTKFEWKYMAGSKAIFNLTKLSSGRSIYDNWITSNNKSRMGKTEEDKQMRKLFSKKTTAFNPSSSVPYPSYPDDPIVVQSNFSRGGTVSGYLLSDNSTSVLSIPSFMAGMYKEGPEELHTAVAEFITKSREAGVKKIVIDLSGNRGGFLLLAYDTFRQFFPKMDPYSLANSRASDDLNTIGSVLSHVAMVSNDSLKGPLNRTMAQNLGTGDLGMYGTLSRESKPWKSWKELFGPVTINQDNYTNPWRYDFNSTRIIGRLGYNMTGYEDNQRDYEQAFDPENIILLHDGHCGSACFIFSSLMKNIAGVKSVAVGGMPVNGPMQGVAGTRGCQVRQSDAIIKISHMINMALSGIRSRSDKIVRSKLGATAQEINFLPSPIGTPWRDVSASINTLNCLPSSDPQIPYQFLYEASNCRLFYTMDMIQDVTYLWRAAAAFAGGDTSTCVPGSVDGPGSEPNKPLNVSPKIPYANPWGNSVRTNLPRDDPVQNSGGFCTMSRAGGSVSVAAAIFAFAWLL
ncbi:unnamed protein product [Clonostachys rosea f. rosea IK726]|uniref:Uncharacterized protein n=1 Tax=Clonostachys rosea f. rosea IK726 TaxID=1349383 RepID=A0ACA9UKT8_BIOOC|nr:unnamed protein product [Clonostachys rosea f. rosea IK726]